MNEQNNPILEVKNLRVFYHTYAGEVKAVRGVQFSLEKGQALAIVGESGCGKSVTAKSIMGLIKAPQGEIKENSEILYHGENILKYNKKQWQHYKGGECAIIFQDALASLNPTMRVGKQIMENLMGHKNMTKQEAAKEAVEMLRMVGIPEPEKRVRQYPHEFSGGMRQRVMIAIAFACDPKILICDEPTTALDVTIQGQILDIIKNLQKKNQTSVIMITHDLGVINEMADSVAVMYCGQVVEMCPAHAIFARDNAFSHPYTEGLMTSIPRLDTLSTPSCIPTIAIDSKITSPVEYSFPAATQSTWWSFNKNSAALNGSLDFLATAFAENSSYFAVYSSARASLFSSSV